MEKRGNSCENEYAERGGREDEEKKDEEEEDERREKKGKEEHTNGRIKQGKGQQIVEYNLPSIPMS